MSTQRINGLSFDIDLGGIDVHSDTFTLDIEDNTTVAKTKGRPDGWLQGDAAASGEMELSISEYKKLKDKAKAAGSWQQLETFDINSYAKVGDDELKVEAFGCKLKISSLLDIDSSSTDKSTIKLPFDVTGRDFINIDGVPYLETLKK